MKHHKLLKMLALTGVFIATGTLMSGCNRIYPVIDYHMFISSKNVNSLKDKDIEIKGIDLSKPIINNKLLNTISTNISNLFKTVSSKDFFLSNFSKEENFYKPIKSFFTDSYYDSFIADKTKCSIFNTVENIYSKENSDFKEANIVKISQDIDNIHAYVQVVSVNDSEYYTVQYLDFAFDDNLKIISVTTTSSPASVKTTLNPLTDKSLIPDNNNEFKNAFDSLTEKMQGKKLYEDLISAKDNKNQKELNECEVKLNSLITSLGYNDDNSTTLNSMFISGRGVFKNYKVVDISYSDIDGKATTNYILRFVNGEETKDYQVIFDRINNSFIDFKEITNE